MPQSRAAKDALRTSLRRRAVNDQWRQKLRRLQRQFRKSLAAAKLDDARSLSHDLQSTLDRMARRHIVHRNTAARLKSRLSASLRRSPTAHARGAKAA